MALFGIYPEKYLGGNPFGFGASRAFPTMGFGYGMHPSAMPSSGVNYFTGGAINPPPYMQQTMQVSPLAQTLNINNGLQTQNPQNQPRNDMYTPQTDSAKLLNMQYLLETAKNEQGVIGKTIDSIKGMTGLGLSSKKCQQYIDAAKAGQMNINDVYNKLLTYSSKQKGMLNTVTGLAAGGLSILAATKGGAKFGFNSFAAALGVGAAAKAGLKTIDRATNNIKSDALNGKTILKDGLQGALNGAVSYTMAHTLKSKNSADALTNGKAAILGLRGGTIAGAAIGAGDYAVECAMDENQQFNINEFVQNTAYSAAAGGLIGAAAGGITAGIKNSKGHSKPTEPATNAGDTPTSKPEIKPEPKTDTKSEPKPEIKPEPKTDTKPEPKTDTKPEPKTDTKPEAKPEIKPEPKADTKSEPKTDTKSEPKPEIKPEPNTDTKSEPKTDTKSETKPEIKPEPKPEIKPEPKADTKSEAKPEIKPEPKTEIKPESNGKNSDMQKPENNMEDGAKTPEDSDLGDDKNLIENLSNIFTKKGISNIFHKFIK